MPADLSLIGAFYANSYSTFKSNEAAIAETIGTWIAIGNDVLDSGSERFQKPVHPEESLIQGPPLD